MQFEPAMLEGVAHIRLHVQPDERGSFARTFCEAEFRDAGYPFSVVQANVSRNKAARTLRGLHFQQPPFGEPKVVSCSRGRIWDVAVDIRPSSPTFRRWEAFQLSEDSATAIFLPAGIAHGFLTLEPHTEVNYFMGAAFVAEAARGIRWDDPAIGIDWPAQPALISERDRSFPLLDQRP
jgi:dTDP-4-dehydrorhamnose 3,5-epimerase